jgi:mono/diheme cytochrome c family protein
VKLKPGWSVATLCGLLFLGMLCLIGTPAKAQETGESLFKGKCAMCHGPDGAGKTTMGQMLKIPDLRSVQVQKETNAQLTEIITKGKQKMPAYGDKLSKEQVEKLVTYIRELGKKH